ncbi:MAG: class D beta-lactamase [Hyphomicrobiaceae bacterium]
MSAPACITRRRLLTGGGVVALLAAVPFRAAATANHDLDAVLREAGISGCFAHLDTATDRLTLANGVRAAERFIPASTFKFANALIALETGAVRDEHEVFRWDGSAQPFPAWQQDLTFGEAFAVSSVPVFQQVARRIGPATYEAWLDRLGYGNGAVGDTVDRFWLDGPLRISAIEQAGFLAALGLGELPLSQASQAIVRRMALVEMPGAATLHLKTGWCTACAPDVGWWTGWVDRGGRIDSFALNIDMTGAAELPRRAEIGKAMLRRLDLW